MKVQTCGHSSANGSNVGTNKKHAAADDDGLVKLQNDLFQRASTRDLYLPFFLPLLTVKRQSHCISFLPCKIYTDMGSSPRGSMPTANLQSTISSIQVSLKMLKTLNISRRILLQVHCRGIQTHRAATTTIGLSPSSMMGQAARKEREEGNISSVFASLSGEAEKPFPPRFAELKRTIIGDEANQRRLIAGWKTLTERLAEASKEIE